MWAPSLQVRSFARISQLPAHRFVTVLAHMLFVNKFCSHWKYYNIKHDIPDLASKKKFSVQSQQLE